MGGHGNSGQLRRSKGGKVLLSLALVALAWAATFGSATHSFSTTDVVGISSLALAVNALLLSVTAWLVRSRPKANAIIAGTTLAGLLTMHVVHTGVYGDDVATSLLLSSAAYFALFVGLYATDQRPWVGVAVAVVALAGIGVVLLRPVVRSAVLEYRAPPSVDRLVEVEFQQKPNVYLVGFDGMIPAALLGRLGVDSAQGTPFHELMSRRFRVFRNFFSNDVSTVQAYNTAAVAGRTR